MRSSPRPPMALLWNSFLWACNDLTATLAAAGLHCLPMSPGINTYRINPQGRLLLSAASQSCSLQHLRSVQRNTHPAPLSDILRYRPLGLSPTDQ